MSQDLHRALLCAHAAQNQEALVALYTRAARQADRQGRADAACFYLTQALVFALEGGLPQAQALNQDLVARGRAHPLPQTV